MARTLVASSLLLAGTGWSALGSTVPTTITPTPPQALTRPAEPIAHDLTGIAQGVQGAYLAADSRWFVRERTADLPAEQCRSLTSLSGGVKSGTNRAVLVSELLALDGPFVVVADDFVAGRCSRCGEDAGDDAFFLDIGFLCGTCARLVEH